MLESDLIFEERVLKRLIDNPYPSLVLVDKFESWMDGTVVTLNEDDTIRSFIAKREFQFDQINTYFKTVNIYKFSKNFSELYYVPFLEVYCKALGTNEYYEQVLKVITFLEDPQIKAVRLNGEKWYEIDDVQDLDIAETIFLEGKEKLKRFQERYGGYWRYPKLLDFCYLVNTYFPNSQMMAELRVNFSSLVQQYPSGMEVNALLAAKNFNLHSDQIVVGNGAAELIKSVMKQINGKIGMVFPSFEEYANRREPQDIVAFYPNNRDYQYTVEDLIRFFDRYAVQALLIVNPDNPSGNYICKKDLMHICSWCKTRAMQLIVDESFIDFVEIEKDKSLLETSFLYDNPHLFVIKSLSKSYGVPGLRLGIMASGDTKAIEAVKQDVCIWNINSFAEFFMQIYEKYRSSYQAALRQFYQQRSVLLQELSKISFLRAVPSQANYILCELVGAYTSTALAVKLLEQDILIKDLSGKRGFEDNQYIRIAVRNTQDNNRLISALKALEMGDWQ